MNREQAAIPEEQPAQSNINLKLLKQIYKFTLPIAGYFFFSQSAQIRWPWVSITVVMIEAIIGGFGAIAFFTWVPISLIFGNRPFTERLAKFGIRSMIWAAYLVPLMILFDGIKHLMESPVAL
jgi:hypothetical protein